MNAAKNMDSVFAACTESELDFDVMFDDDDSIIDSIAGVDEAGNFLTGEDFDWEAFDALGEDSDMVGEKPDFDYPNDEVGSNFEDSKDRKIEVGGEVGDGKEVSGKENSAEAHAYDDTKDIDDSIGLNDKQQTSLEAFDLIDLIETDEVKMGTMDNIKNTEAEKLVCPKCGKNPCECKKVSEASQLDMVLDLLNEEESPIDDPCDCAQRAGKAGNGVSDTEGKDQEVIGAAMDGNTKEDPIADDIDDAEARAGKADSVQDTEGKDTHAVGAALEDVDFNAELLSLIEAEEELEEGCKKEEAEEVDAEEDNTPPEEDKQESCKEDASEGPLEDDDVAERSGATSDAAVETESCKKESDDVEADDDEDLEESTLDMIFDLLDEETQDPIEDDIDDAEARAGKADPVKDTEGVDQDPVGAALEANDFLDDIINAVDPDEQIVPDNINLDAFLLGDEVVQDLDNDADIKVAKESTEDDVIDDEQEDEAIENIDDESDSEGGANIESDYDDDELIDAVINGDIEDL